jgi:hypothetical protein
LSSRERCRFRRDARDVVRIVLHLRFAPVANPSSVRFDSKAIAKRQFHPASIPHSPVVNAQILSIVV